MSAWNSKTDAKVTVVMFVIASMGMVYCCIPSDEEMAQSPATITSSEAFEKCRPGIESQIARQETIDFNLFDTTMHADGSNANFSVTGTAENAFGTAIKFRAICHFEYGSLVSVNVSEA